MLSYGGGFFSVYSDDSLIRTSSNPLPDAISRSEGVSARTLWAASADSTSWSVDVSLSTRFNLPVNIQYISNNNGAEKKKKKKVYTIHIELPSVVVMYCRVVIV